MKDLLRIFGGQLVPNADLGKNILWFCRIFLDLSPDVGHVDAKDLVASLPSKVRNKEHDDISL